ncbi:hypothetical protein BURCENBC7_AP6389 [Burkholderia cenocepacia BC7]|nr:hypothetical protein BURCENBC7_AP6389 [Burkholderia cenocepacia BC7]
MLGASCRLQVIQFHINSLIRRAAYAMTLTRYETLLIMPRTAGVSCSSLTELSRRRPRPRTVARCDSRVPIRLLTS